MSNKQKITCENLGQYRDSPIIWTILWSGTCPVSWCQIKGILLYSPLQLYVQLQCRVKEETSAHILCECEALALLRRMYLGSFFLEPEDIKSISLRAIWNFSKATGLPWFDMGHKGPVLVRPRCIRTVRPHTQMQSINQGLISTSVLNTNNKNTQ